MSIFRQETDNLLELFMTSKGEVKADLVIVGGKLVNVFSGEIYPADVAIKRDRIVYVGEVGHTIGEKTEVLNAEGKYLVPGLIETHMHVGGSQLNMTELAKVLLLKGTTSILTDFYEIAIVSGMKGITFCLDELRRTPLKAFFQIGSQIYLQNGGFGNTGTIKPGDLLNLLTLPECVGISEWPLSAVEERNPAVLTLITETLNRGKLILGHISEASTDQVNEYKCLGPSSDHESVGISEALEKLRLGYWLMLREGTAAKDLKTLLKIINEHKVETRHLMFCTDEEDPANLYENGHIDKKIRMSIQEGISPIAAIQMATLNAAEYLGLSQHLGSISPGKKGDIVLVEDLSDFRVCSVIANGHLVASDQVYLGELEKPKYPDWIYNTVRLKQLVKPSDVEVRVEAGKTSALVRVIGQRKGTLITESLVEEMVVNDGMIASDVHKDILKLVYVERHHESGKIAKGFVKGFGLKEGAIGSTFNPECENIVALGVEDRDLCVTINRLKEMGGGFVVSRNGKVINEVPLPLFGLLSDKEYPVVVREIKELNSAIRHLGCQFEGPLTQLAFICVPREIGTLKISEEGLVDVWNKRKVDLVVG